MCEKQQGGVGRYLGCWMNKHLPRRCLAGSGPVVACSVPRLLTQFCRFICWQNPKDFSVSQTRTYLVFALTSLSTRCWFWATTENPTLSMNLCNIYVRRPQTVSLHCSLTVMDWINTSYWKRAPLWTGNCSVALTADRRSGLGLISRGSLSRWISTSISLPAVDLVCPPVNSESLRVRSRNTMTYKKCVIYIQTSPRPLRRLHFLS